MVFFVCLLVFPQKFTKHKDNLNYFFPLTFTLAHLRAPLLAIPQWFQSAVLFSVHICNFSGCVKTYTPNEQSNPHTNVWFGA